MRTKQITLSTLPSVHWIICQHDEGRDNTEIDLWPERAAVCDGSRVIGVYSGKCPHCKTSFRYLITAPVTG